MNTPFDNHLTEAELAARIKARTGEGSVRSLRKMRQRRKGPAWVKIGRKILYPVSGLEPWLQSLTQQPARSRKAVA